eukprot:834229-Pyramimonas_sp.AAC.1
MLLRSLLGASRRPRMCFLAALGGACKRPQRPLGASKKKPLKASKRPLRSLLEVSYNLLPVKSLLEAT